MANQAIKKNTKKSKQVLMVNGLSSFASIVMYILGRKFMDSQWVPIHPFSFLVNVLFICGAFYWIYEAAKIGNHSEIAFDIYWISVASLCLGTVWSKGIYLSCLIPAFLGYKLLSWWGGQLKASTEGQEAPEEGRKNEIKGKKLSKRKKTTKE
jgi:SRP-independent targeting protein 2/TMEM208